jgi:hypothetical protein
MSGQPVKGTHMKNKAKIAIAAGAVLASTLAVAPVQAHAAAPALIGSCSQGFACAWGTNGVLFWEANGPENIDFVIDSNVTDVENLTGYYMSLYWALYKGGPGGWASIPPHSGLYDIGGFSGNGYVYVTGIELES